MPWGRKRKSHHFPTSIWNTPGATCSAKNACHEFGVTLEDLEEAKIPCHWRSYMGSSFAVVERSRVREVANKIKMKEEEEKENALIKKYGKKKLAAMRADENAKKEMVGLMLKISQYLSSVPQSLPTTGTLSKGKARELFLLQPKEFTSLTCIKEGRSLKYLVTELLAVTEKKWGREEFARRRQAIADRANDRLRAPFEESLAALLKKFGKHVEMEARAEVVTKLKEKARAADVAAKIANDVAKKAHAMVVAFEKHSKNKPIKKKSAKKKPVKKKLVKKKSVKKKLAKKKQTKQINQNEDTTDSDVTDSD